MRNKRLRYAAVLIVFISVLGGSCAVVSLQKNSIDPVSSFRWQTGTYRYNCGFTSDTLLTLEGTGIKTDISMESVLNLKVFSANDETAEIGLYTGPVSVFVNGANDPSLEYIYQIPVLIKVSADGSFKEMQFPANTSEKQIKALKGLYTALEMVIRNEQSYQTLQQDSAGTYETRYERSGLTFRKEKMRYTELTANDQQSVKTEAVIKNSLYSFAPSASGPWLEYMRGKEETVHKTKNGEELIRADQHFYLEFIGETEEDYRDFFTGIQYSGAEEKFRNRVKIYQNTSRAQLQQITAEETKIKNLRKFSEGLGQKNSREKSLALRAFLLENPEVIKLIPEMVLNMELDDVQAGKIINILGLIGIPEAQYALADITSDPAQTENNRLRAVISFSSLSQPIMDEVKDILFSRLGDIAVSSQSIGLYTSSVLVLGTVSKNINEDYPMEAEELAEEIRNRLSSGSVIQKKYLLKSLGNTYNENYSAVIGSYAGSSNEALRKASVEALKYMEDSYSERLLADRLVTESSEKVRYAVTKSLMTRELTDETAEKVSQAGLKETDRDIRRGIIDIIDKNIKYHPDMLSTLEEMAKTETSEVNIRKMIRAAAKVR